MATVAIPLLLKDVTGGVRQAKVCGSTLEQIISELNNLHPGFEARVRDGDTLSPVVAITVDGKIAVQGLATPVGPDSEVCILPSFGGG
jgi:molybdopterin converting factor small subunit